MRRLTIRHLMLAVALVALAAGSWRSWTRDREAPVGRRRSFNLDDWHDPVGSISSSPWPSVMPDLLKPK